jgi:hypothetical protein
MERTDSIEDKIPEDAFYISDVSAERIGIVLDYIPSTIVDTYEVYEKFLCEEVNPFANGYVSYVFYSYHPRSESYPEQDVVAVLQLPLKS